MSFWKNFLFGLTIAVNCLLGFLLIFYDRFLLPSWLQVIGRMHPLFLHFPIVLLVLCAVWILMAPRLRFAPPTSFQHTGKWLLLFTALCCAITALMGLFLSKEPGYNPDSLQWHKWSGILVSWLTVAWYAVYDRLYRSKALPVIALASLLLIIFTGHQGADITHGENFLLAPITAAPVQKKPSFDEAVVFADMVKPILESRCMNCHNSKKAKGELVMETRQLLLKGGKNGKLWDTAKADLGLLFERIHLPPEEKKHMPPAGKPQLTDEETTILYNWVKQGADFNLKVRDLSATDTLRNMASYLFKSTDMEDSYDFAPANEKTVSQLNTNYRVIHPIAQGSPALAVDVYGPAFFKADQLKELEKIKGQIVSLNLNKMPVTDADLATIGQFLNLRRLHLSSTKISGSGLVKLTRLTHLKDISLSNTGVKGSDILQLASLKELRHIYSWNSAVTDADISSIQRDHPDVHLDAGMRTDTILVKLNPPILQNEEVIIDTPIQLRLKHYVPGIAIRYTLDGSEPDSLHSPVYEVRTTLSGMATLKARAFKPGWLASDLLQYQFYHTTFTPDTLILLQPPDSLFKGKGSKTLYNHEKGDLNLRSGKWLGFHKTSLVCLLKFPHAVDPQDITLGSVVDTSNHIFPPQSIEVWGGNDPQTLRLLGRSAPEQSNFSKQAYLTFFECKFRSSPVKYLKIVASPLVRLPKQQLNKKDNKGWFFVDELFVN